AGKNTMPPWLRATCVVLAACAISGPQRLGTEARAASPVGTRVNEFQLPDHRGHEHRLGDFQDKPQVEVAFLGTECPLAKLYSARLQALSEEYADRGVAFLGVCSNVQDSLADITHYVQQHELKYPVLKDRANQVADLLGAERTPQVFLLDQD